MTRVSTVFRKSNQVVTERKERHSTTSLILDIDKCTGCDICWTICPRDAIERGPIGASRRKRVTAPPIRINYHKCIFCGLCAYICPFEALKLMINNKPAEKIKRGISLPYLEGERVDCKNTGGTALKYLEGEIEVDSKRCPGGCSTCIAVCPVDCLSLPIAPKDKPWKKTPKVKVVEEDCLFCGACLFACPTKWAIKINRTFIKHSEEGSSSQVWKNMEEKLLKPVRSRDWFFEVKLKASPGGEEKSAPKRKELMES